MKVCRICERAITLREHEGEPVIYEVCGYCKKGIDALNEYLATKGRKVCRIVEPEDIDRMLEDAVYRVHHQPIEKPMTRAIRRDRWNRKGRKYG